MDCHNNGLAAELGLGAPAPAAPAPKDLIKDTSTAAFSADVIAESRRQPVLVDFWAPWCGPCRQLTPALERTVLASAGRVKLVKMNIDEHPSIAGQLGIKSIPAVIVFKDGKPVDGFMGAVPENQILDLIDRVAGPGDDQAGLDEALAAAAEAKQLGDRQTAADIYSALREQYPDNVAALVGLAELLFEDDALDEAESILAEAPQGGKPDPSLAALITRIALARQARTLGDPAALERRLASDPNDHEARFDLAMIQNALGERQQAADSLLAIVKADRAWRDDGARAQLLKLFEAWGMTDPATLSARRRLSSLLFS